MCVVQVSEKLKQIFSKHFFSFRRSARQNFVCLMISDDDDEGRTNEQASEWEKGKVWWANRGVERKTVFRMNTTRDCQSLGEEFPFRRIQQGTAWQVANENEFPRFFDCIWIFRFSHEVFPSLFLISCGKSHKSLHLPETITRQRWNQLNALVNYDLSWNMELYCIRCHLWLRRQMMSNPLSHNFAARSLRVFLFFFCFMRNRNFRRIWMLRHRLDLLFLSPKRDRNVKLFTRERNII